MSDFPTLTGKRIMKVLKKAGFEVIRNRGSHHFMKHPDGRCTVIPIHSNETIGRGLFSKILHDCDISRIEFIELLR